MTSQDRIWRDWPVCPQCGRRRQTVCPVCGAAGNRFSLAEYQAMEEPQRGTRDATKDEHMLPASRQQILLLCPDCDEAFAPRFYRVCPACGYDAGEGIDIGRKREEQISNRVLLAIYGLCAVAALVLLYFWLLFQDS